MKKRPKKRGAVQRRTPAPAPVPANAGGCGSDEQLERLWLHGRPESTAKAYGADLAWWVSNGLPRAWRALRLADCQAALERAATASGGVGRPASLARRIAALRSLLAFGHRIGYLPLDVGALLRPHRVPQELAERILEPEEVLRLLAAAGDSRSGARDHALVRVGYVAGARIAELVRLDWGHVHPAETGARLTLHGKGTKTRHVWITPGTAAELEALRAVVDPEGKGGPIFRARTGKRLGVRDGERVLERAAKRAKLRHVSPHWLRHAHATHALERGSPIHEVADQLGHASVATTSRYLHVRPGPGSARWLGL